MGGENPLIRTLLYGSSVALGHALKWLTACRHSVQRGGGGGGARWLQNLETTCSAARLQYQLRTLSEATVPCTENPLEWRCNSTRFQLLAPLAMKYLGILATKACTFFPTFLLTTSLSFHPLLQAGHLILAALVQLAQDLTSPSSDVAWKEHWLSAASVAHMVVYLGTWSSETAACKMFVLTKMRPLHMDVDKPYPSLDITLINTATNPESTASRGQLMND
ncbi:hypothetical protein PR048_028977 [Dryococelus australis]|uniref:Uncharacterized protein n=1 Tax=Dryococelus australis TaxID=614101 RepID=A0ABQ9GEL0_9NEOP|nr:hypothetical protein PR048_028977 [Dryococelus australis]